MEPSYRTSVIKGAVPSRRPLGSLIARRLAAGHATKSGTLVGPFFNVNVTWQAALTNVK